MPEAVKREVIEIIERMPEGTSLEDIVYELYFRARVNEGLRDIREGRTISHEEMRREVAQWLQSTGH